MRNPDLLLLFFRGNWLKPSLVKFRNYSFLESLIHLFYKLSPLCKDVQSPLPCKEKRLLILMNLPQYITVIICDKQRV